MGSFLVGIGGRAWTGGSNRRVYIPVPVASRAIGLVVHRYDSGNVSSATLHGDKISNGEARELLAKLDGAYFDVVANKFVGCGATLRSAFTALIEAQTEAQS